MFRIVLFVVLTGLYAGLLAWPVKFLWNLVVPELFDLQQISFWQGFALVAISRVLFGMRLVGFLLWTAVVGAGVGWVAQWLWNMVGPPLFHLPSVTWLQAGALVALLQILVGGMHHWRRVGRKTRWDCWESIEAHIQDHGRMHKEEWNTFRRQMHCHGQRWKEWADERAPGGSHRNWRHFDEFWREKRNADFEEWLKGRGREK